jgi:hypothetical protein
VEIDRHPVWRFFLTLIFQWAVIVLERAMLFLVLEQENPDPDLNQDQNMAFKNVNMLLTYSP